MSQTRETAINSYVTDMLALEEHIEKALQAQLDEFRREYPALGAEFADMHGNVARHISVLKALAPSGGHGVGDVLKRATSIVAGVGAAAIDLVRTEKLPKDLRDDYTAFSLANIGYMMLYTTATSLGSLDIAEVAERHYQDYTRMIMDLARLVPSTVVQLLQEQGLPARSDVLADVQRTVTEAWRGESPIAH